MTRFGRIVVVTKRTQMQELLDRFVTEGQARFYLEHMGLSFSEYAEAHARYETGLKFLEGVLPDSPRHVVIDRSFLPTFTFEDRDLVVTLGGNGLVVNTAKYVDTQPILAVNPDPARHEAILVPFRLSDVRVRVEAALRGSFQMRRVSMAEARLNDGQTVLGFNDLFIGQRGHASARYRIEFAGKAEDQSSSGIIIATGAGSTGWIQSVLAGSVGVVRSACPRIQGLPAQVDTRFDWAADYLRFAVREPFPSVKSQAGIVFGTIEGRRPLRVVSKMPEGGVIFSDGVESDATMFTSGAVAEVKVADRKAGLIVP